MGRLDNKTAVVTGATSGIGEASAIMFAKEGATVVCTGRNRERGAAVVKKIEDAGGKAYFFPADLTIKEELLALHDFALKTLGHIDILMNNSGVLVHKPYLEHTDEDLDLIFKTNFRSYTWNMQAYIPDMIANGGGSIINVASISSVWPEVNAYYYGAMKAAISNLSKNVAKEFARQKVRVNCILPGPILTGMTPEEAATEEGQKAMVDSVCLLGRLGVPDDIAYGAVYLASDESAMMTGEALTIDCALCISN
ncbi:MAG: SDR family oxidoreductase [bacterium]|nr:SDR family oxidoreductase [bacterium]